MALPATLLAIVLLALPVGCTHATAEESLSFGRFGRVSLYRAGPNPAHVALFVSGDGGWNRGVVDMARTLASLDALVVGVDVTRYLQAAARSREACTYAAADFEALSQFVQKRLDRPRYDPPVLVGYSSGATLVYATLAQAPAGTFRGAISLGFCPDLALRKPLCRGQGLTWGRGGVGQRYEFLPAASLAAPWVVLQGGADRACPPAATQAYVKDVPHADLVLFPEVGHGFSAPGNWAPELRAAFSRVAEAGEPAARPRTDDVKDLPLVEVAARGPDASTLAVIVSGDGGWAGLDRDIADRLAGQGIPVAGLNSLEYFWHRRAPDEAAQALERVLRHYLAAWRKERAILIGYSRGADVLPFMASRLPEDLRRRVALVALLGPSHRVAFEFHVTDWFSSGSGGSALPVPPEVERLRGTPMLCVYGADETDTICPGLDPGLATPLRLAGGHHFGGDYGAIADAILKAATEPAR